MCLAVPVRIVELHGEDAVVERGGARRRCNVTFVPNPRVGEYVLLHAGFGIAKWTEEDVRAYEEARRALEAAGPA